FFASRRRHTRFSRDWSSDVCSSDLNVGIALGERATPAARRAADVVVTDERIETLVDAVLEGRALWRSVRDAVALLVGGNLGEIRSEERRGGEAGRRRWGGSQEEQE